MLENVGTRFLQYAWYALLMTIVSAQTVNFTVLPSSQDVVEGGNATFECAANDGTQPYTVIWTLRRGSEVVTTISSSRAVNGTGGAVVGTNGSPLVLTSVMRTLNGITVSCSAVINAVTIVEQTEPPATLTLAYFGTVSPALIRKISLSSRLAAVLVWSVPPFVVDDIDSSVISVVMFTPSGPKAIRHTTVGKQVRAFAVDFPKKGARYQVTVHMTMNGLHSRPLTVEVDV